MSLVRQLEIALDLAATVGVLLYVPAALRRGARERTHARLVILLVLIALGIGCRGVVLGAGWAWARHVQFLGFGAFPIAALLFGEAATGRASPLAIKVLALVATTAFAVTWPTKVIDAGWYLLTMMGYQMLVLLHVTARFVTSALALPVGPRRSTLGLMALLAGAALAAVLSENTEVLAWSIPHLGGGALLGLTYVAACSFHADGVWGWRAVTLRMVIPILGSVGLALAVGVLAPDTSRTALIWVAALPVLAFFALDPARTALDRAAQRRADVLFARMSHLGTDGFDGLLTNLRTWPEIRAVDLILRAQLLEQGYDDLDRFFAASPGPVDRRSVLPWLRGAGNQAAIRAAEQVHDLLARRNGDVVIPLAAGSLLVLTFDGFVDQEALRLAMTPVGELARLVYERRGAGA